MEGAPGRSSPQRQRASREPSSSSRTPAPRPPAAWGARVAAFFAAMAVFACIEFAWLSAVRPIYDAYITELQPDWSGAYKPSAAAACYAIIAILVFALFAAPLGTPREMRIWEAALVGFAMYGVYHTTNLATLDRASWRVAALDTAWGATAMAAVLSVAKVVFESITRRRA